MTKMWQDIIVSIVIVIALIVGLAYTLSPDWSVQRRLFIDAKPDLLADRTLTVKNWEKWNTWAVSRSITDIQIIKRNKYDATFSVKTKAGDYECLVLLMGDELGAYDILKVKGSYGKKLFTRYAMFTHDQTFGRELTASLKTLNDEVKNAR